MLLTNDEALTSPGNFYKYGILEPSLDPLNQGPQVTEVHISFGEALAGWRGAK